MPIPAERRDLRLMRAMFSTIAPRYDFITRIFSYGMDRRWKRQGIEMAGLPDGAMVLDLASGTGDFSQLAMERCPGARSIAVDLTERMLRLARERGIPDAVCADATILPFPDETFDCVFIGYGLRNFPDLNAALREIERVTRPGGLLVTLDFFLPANPVLRQLYVGYLYVQGGFWGLLLHGRPRIYTYIPDSLRSFTTMQDFADRLRRLGYPSVRARGFIFGGIGLHWAAKGGSKRPEKPLQAAGVPHRRNV
jgi:demethylmenaquinone methyltransferase/2-methoxy-6-polyprenyl-1,4-benzoquinol methylase